MSHRFKPHFKKHRQTGVNLTGSAKLGNFAKRKKWINLKFETNQIKNELPLERTNRLFALEWEKKQKIHGHYGIKKQKQWKLTPKLNLWETRLDITLWKSHLVSRVFQARQRILHGFVRVNNKRVKIPSYQLEEGDLVRFKPKDKYKKNLLDKYVNTEFFTKKLMEPKSSVNFLGVPDHLEVSFSHSVFILAYKPSIEEVRNTLRFL